MSNLKKEITIDFNLYVDEKTQAFNQGSTNGYNIAFNSIVSFLSKKQDIDSFIGDKEFNPHWGHLLVALGRKEEWENFIKSRKEKEEQKEKAVSENEENSASVDEAEKQPIPNQEQ